MKPVLIFVLFVGLFACNTILLDSRVSPPFAQKLLAPFPSNLQRAAPQSNIIQPSIQSDYNLNQPRKAMSDSRYILSWKWACRQQTGFGSCQGLFYWNNQLIANITPSDYDVHRATYEIQGLNGVNQLRIEGSGTSDGYGLTIDDVSLVKKGKSYNYIVNGGFEAPDYNDGSGNVYSNNITGWAGSNIGLAKGSLYNSGWTSVVCELDGFGNAILSQYITLTVQSDYTNKFVTPESLYILSWKWACRQQTSFGSCQGLFYWNDQLIANITPSDYKIHQATYKIHGLNGVNKLRIEGSGSSDNHGLTIDDLSLVKKGRSHNYIVNGNFESPNLNGGIGHVFSNITGWTGHDIQMGMGNVYNPAWTSQICQLDGIINSLLNQQITLKVRSSSSHLNRGNKSNNNRECESYSNQSQSTSNSKGSENSQSDSH